MHVDGYLVLGSAVVGLLVGMTGAGGGALMTPMLIFLFGVSPASAISSDLVATVIMRPVGAAVHLRRRTVNLRMVGWLATGSVPGGFLGAFLLHLMGSSKQSQKEIEIILGTALLLGATAMVVRALVRQRSGGPVVRRVPVRPLPTAVIGGVGGVMVGLTSVGAGSLMLVLLLFVYPAIASSELVGTDLVQAVPLTAAAALGQLLFGHVELAVTASVVIGSVPAVFAGALLSSRAPHRLIRPVVAAVIVVSGLKYVGVPPAGLGVAAVAAAAAGLAWLVVRRRGPAVAGGGDGVPAVAGGGDGVPAVVEGAGTAPGGRVGAPAAGCWFSPRAPGTPSPYGAWARSKWSLGASGAEPPPTGRSERP